MSITKKDVLKNLDEIKKYIEEIEKPNLELENKNFRINSVGWKMERTNIKGLRVLVNPEGDIWEYLDGEFKGEQLFTFDSMMRETKKRNKKVPTDDEFDKLIFDKDDIKGGLLAGTRSYTGSFGSLGLFGNFWSSTENGSSAWRRILYTTESRVYRSINGKSYGYSVRCLKH